MKRDDTSFPQMGEEGCGSRNPTCSLLICLQCFLLMPFCFFSYSWKAFGASCRKGKEERGIMSLFKLESSNFRQYFRCICHKSKNQWSNITKRWWERQRKNNFFLHCLSYHILTIYTCWFLTYVTGIVEMLAKFWKIKP